MHAYDDDEYDDFTEVFDLSYDEAVFVQVAVRDEAGHVIGSARLDERDGSITVLHTDEGSDGDAPEVLFRKVYGDGCIGEHTCGG